MLCEGTDCISAKSEHYRKVAVDLEQELSDTQAELESLRDFCQSEIRKLPPEYVKDKGRAGDE